MKVFDARTVYGTGFMKPPVSENIGAHLKACETERAVIVMEEQLYLPPDESLIIARNRVASHPGAYGLVMLAPACTGEMPPVEKTASLFKRERFAGFLLSPAELNIPFRPVFLSAELEAAQRFDIPVFYHVSGKENTMEYAADVLSAYSSLRMVLSFADEWPNTRKIYPLLLAFPGLCVCLSEFVWMGGIEDFCNRFGSERLLYSSSFPTRYPGGSMLMLKNAEITQQDKDNIAYRNLERLIGGMAL